MNVKVDSPWSWLVTLSCFLIHVAMFGLVYSFGIFYVALLKDFPGQESATASIVGIHLGTMMIASPLTITLSHRFTPRVVCCGGVLLASTSFYLASMAENLVTLYCTFGIMFGLASSFSYLPTIIVLRANFKKHLPLAYAIGISGSGVGGGVFSLLLPTLFESRGWRGALRLLSFAMLGLVVCGLVLFQCEQETWDPAATDLKPKKNSASKTGNLRKMRRVLTPSSWRNKAFVVLNIVFVLIYFVFPVPYCHIVNFAMQQGLSLSESSKLPLILAAGTTVGRLAAGPISSHRGFSRITLCQVIFLIICVAITLCPLASSATLLIVFAGTFGVFEGAVNVLVPLVVDDVFADPRQALKALGSLFAMFCVPYTLGSPLAGWLYSIRGSYNIVFYTCGCLLFVAACLMSLVNRLLPSAPGRHRSFIDVPECIVVQSSPSGRDSLNLNPNPTNGRLMSLKMCSLLDLSTDVFSQTDNPADEYGSCRTYYENMSRVHPVSQFSGPTEPFLQRVTISENSFRYTDITNQISGLTQSRRSPDREAFLNEAAMHGEADIESIELIGPSDVWELDEENASSSSLIKTSSLDVIYDGLEGVSTGIDDMAYTSSSSVENVKDLCSADTPCSSSSLHSDRGSSTDSAYGSLDGFQLDTFGEQGTPEDFQKPCTIEDDQLQVENDDFKNEFHEA